MSAAGNPTEAAGLATVVSYARWSGWELIYHPPAGGKGGQVDREQVGSGFPDLVLLRGPELVVAELKVGKAGTKAGEPRPDQVAWLEGFARLGLWVAQAVGATRSYYGAWPWDNAPPRVDAFVWRPSDWDEVQARLRRPGDERAF